MGIKVIDILCTSCQAKEEKVIDYPEEWNKEWECASCGGLALRTVSSPAIRTSDSRTFLDGTDRGQEFNNMKMAAKLKVLAADMAPNERSEIKKEIRKLGAGTDDL